MRIMHLTEGDSRKVIVKAVGGLTLLLGTKETVLEVAEQKSLLDLLKMLPEKLKNKLLIGDDVAPDVLVLVNGVELSCLGSPRGITVLGADIREVVLIPVIHGG